MRASIDIWNDLRAELRRIRTGEVWVVTYSIHKDVFEALFEPFRDSFTFHILVDCGGICPAGLTTYGPELTQVHDATLHAKIVFIEPAMAGVRPLAYFLTGNIRQSLVVDENLCVKTELSPGVTTALRTWLRSVRAGKTNKQPFLLCLDADSGTQKHIKCRSLGAGILAVLKAKKVDVGKAVLMAPWGSNFTVKRLFDGLTSLKKLDIYAGYNGGRGDQQSNVWVASIPSHAKCDISRFVQSQNLSSFVHAKAAMFSGLRRSRAVTFVYTGSGNLTMKGFWDPGRGNRCPNIECGILLTGTGNTSTKLTKWFTQKVIGSSRRWRQLPAPEKSHAHPEVNTDSTEEFMEDASDFQQNGFERRRLTKIFTKAFGSWRYVSLLRKLCSDPREVIGTRKRLEVMLCSFCRKNGVRTRRVDISKKEIIERNLKHTRVGLLFDTDTLRGIYVVVYIHGNLPYSKDEIVNLIEDLASFGNLHQNSDRDTPKRDNGVKRDEEEKKLNVRFPYRDLFILRDSLQKCDHGKAEFIRKIKRKVSILDELDTLSDSQPNSGVPMWWKSILHRILKEER